MCSGSNGFLASLVGWSTVINAPSFTWLVRDGSAKPISRAASPRTDLIVPTNNSFGSCCDPLKDMFWSLVSPVGMHFVAVGMDCRKHLFGFRFDPPKKCTCLQLINPLHCIFLIVGITLYNAYFVEDMTHQNAIFAVEMIL